MNDIPAIAENQPNTEGRATWRSLLVCLTLAALIYTPFIKTEVGQGNVASDLAAIESLVDRHTFFINGSPFEDTIDKFRRPDGRFFSQKSPLFHLVAAVPSFLLTRAGYPIASNLQLHLRVLTFFMVILPMGVLIWLVYSHPWLRKRPSRHRLFLTLFFALGSLLTPFALTLNHYTAAAAALMLAVRSLILLYETDNQSPLTRRALRLGFWTSASLACDVPPAFLFAAAIGFAWLLSPTKRRLIPWLALGAAPLLLAYAALNQQIIGSPLPPNMHESQMLYYPGSYWSEIKAQADRGEPGYYQASYPRRLLHATLGHKGIYWMWPLLALATLAAIRLARRRPPGWQLPLAFVLFPPATIALAMIWAFDLSGGAYGIRHCFATLPPLYCVLAHPQLSLPSRTLRAIAWLAAIWGLLIALIGAINPWSHNTLSAWPPLENLARLALHHPDRLPTGWIENLIPATSVTPANAWLDYGLELMKGDKLPQAEQALRRALTTDPRVNIVYYHLGIVLDKQGKSGEAISTYQELLRREPDNIGAWNNLGLVALRANNANLAREAYSYSATLAPGNPTADWGLLFAEELEGRTNPDSPRLKEALARHPNDSKLLDLAHRWKAAAESPHP